MDTAEILWFNPDFAKSESQSALMLMIASRLH